MQGGDSNTLVRRGKKKHGLKEEHYWYVHSIVLWSGNKELVIVWRICGHCMRVWIDFCWCKTPFRIKFVTFKYHSDYSTSTQLLLDHQCWWMGLDSGHLSLSLPLMDSCRQQFGPSWYSNLMQTCLCRSGGCSEIRAHWCHCKLTRQAPALTCLLSDSLCNSRE